MKKTIICITLALLALTLGSNVTLAQSVTLTNLITPQSVNGSVTGATVTASVQLPLKYFQTFSGGITNAPAYVTNVVSGVTNVANVITNALATKLQLSLDGVNWVYYSRTNRPPNTNVNYSTMPLSGTATIYVRPVLTTTNAITGGVSMQQ